MHENLVDHAWISAKEYTVAAHIIAVYYCYTFPLLSPQLS